MDLSIVGSGYVGTTIAACFAELGVLTRRDWHDNKIDRCRQSIEADW